MEVIKSYNQKGLEKQDFQNILEKMKIVLHKINDTANELNDFFGHVGFNVAQEIQELRNNNELNKHITQFIGAVSHRGILDVLKTTLKRPLIVSVLT